MGKKKKERRLECSERITPDVFRSAIIQCRDCKYFELDHIDECNGVPLITAHEICTFWGDGCKTRQDAFCAFGSPKS